MERFSFNGLDLSTYNHFSSSDLSVSPKQLLQTTENDLAPYPSPITTGIQEEIAPLESRPVLPQGRPYQISFENSFMAEHRAVFTRQLQNYMEFVGKYLTEYDHTLLRRFPEGLFNVATGMAFEEVLMMSGGDMLETEKMEFIREVKGREKLEEFLNIVADECPSQVAVELLHVAWQLLKGFLESSLRDDEYAQREELLEFGEETMERVQGIKILNLSILPGTATQQLKKKYLRFLQVYCCTVMLVIGQFFENPYSGLLDALKRPSGQFALEEEQEGEGNGPQKKRKFSF